MESNIKWSMQKQICESTNFSFQTATRVNKIVFKESHLDKLLNMLLRYFYLGYLHFDTQTHQDLSTFYSFEC